jgi:hypothetical protein
MPSTSGNAVSAPVSLRNASTALWTSGAPLAVPLRRDRRRPGEQKIGRPRRVWRRRSRRRRLADLHEAHAAGKRPGVSRRGQCLQVGRSRHARVDRLELARRGPCFGRREKVSAPSNAPPGTWHAPRPLRAPRGAGRRASARRRARGTRPRRPRRRGLGPGPPPVRARRRPARRARPSPRRSATRGDRDRPLRRSPRRAHGGPGVVAGAAR